jgi:hypothetical protein
MKVDHQGGAKGNHYGDAERFTVLNTMLASLAGLDSWSRLQSLVAMRSGSPLGNSRTGPFRAALAGFAHSNAPAETAGGTSSALHRRRRQQRSLGVQQTSYYDNAHYNYVFVIAQIRQIREPGAPRPRLSHFGAVQPSGS